MPKKIREISAEKIGKIASKHKLRPRQRNLVTEILRDPNRNGKDIAISAGYAPTFAQEQGGKIIRNDSVQAALSEILRSTGYDRALESAYSKYLELSESGPDGALKLNAMKELHKIRGDYAPTKSQSARVIIQTNRRLDVDDED